VGICDQEDARVGRSHLREGATPPPPMWLKRGRGPFDLSRQMMASSPRSIALFPIEAANLRYIITHQQSKPLPLITHFTTTKLKLLTLLVLVITSYLSMSFLTKFFRPFSSMSNAPAQPMNVPSGAQTATVAAGCFWGVEHMYRREYKGKGLYDARVGYIGGDTDNPGYRAVCSGRTGRTYSSLLLRHEA